MTDMSTLHITIGLPASGKTTLARQLVKESKKPMCRVNRDDLRAMLHDSVWSKEREKVIKGTEEVLIRKYLMDGVDVVCDDTNLSKNTREWLMGIATEARATIEWHDLTGVDVEECVRRDRKRANYVGERVIRKMWHQHIAPRTPMASIVHDPSLPNAIICDLDGTLALHNGRDPYDASECGSDLINAPVQSILLRELEYNDDDHWAQANQILFISGRSEDHRKQTTDWLLDKTNLHEEWVLHMRPSGDYRPDYIVKQEIYEREIKGKYNVLFVLDDRTQVVNMWRRLGLTCLQVAEGDF